MPSYKPMTIQKASNVHEVPVFMAELKRIAAKEVDALTVMEVAFLRARVSYLSAEEKKTFKSVLTVKKTKKTK